MQMPAVFCRDNLLYSVNVHVILVWLARTWRKVCKVHMCPLSVMRGYRGV
jgi:hypothetical protein